MGHYVKVLDHSGKVGFIHSVEEDLELSFETIPKVYLPVVIYR
jgi:hypothetical protein